MDLPVVTCNPKPPSSESALIVFMQGAGNVSTISYKTNTNKNEGVRLNEVYLTSIGFVKYGLLKDDILIQVAKGTLKGNTSDSQKRECNFVLLNCTAANINNSLAMSGLYADIIVLDTANGMIYEMRNMKLDTGFKGQHGKHNEIPFKTSGDGFERPLYCISVIGTGGDVTSLPQTQI